MILTEGTYSISPECKATIVDGGKSVKIVKRKIRVIEDRVKCRDCEFCKEGKYKFSPNQYWNGHYCEKRRKMIGGEDKYFYAVNPGAVACYMFNKKKQEDGGDQDNSAE